MNITAIAYSLVSIGEKHLYRVDIRSVVKQNKEQVFAAYNICVPQFLLGFCSNCDFPAEDSYRQHNPSKYLKYFYQTFIPTSLRDCKCSKSVTSLILG